LSLDPDETSELLVVGLELHLHHLLGEVEHEALEAVEALGVR
jgi:hypothetical protein